MRNHFLRTAVGRAKPVMVYYFPFESGGSPSLANAGSIGGNATAVTVNSSTPAFSTDVPTSIGGSHSQIILMSPPGNQTGGRLDLPSGNSTFRLSTSGEQIAFSAWLKWSGVDGSADIRQGIVSNMNGALNQGWAFSVNSDGKLSLSLGGAPGRRDSASATVVTSGVWTNVAMTYTVGGNPKLFIDGTNVGISSSFGGGIATASTQTLRLGNVDGSFLPVNGILDDVAVWDLMLSDGKMRAIYTTPTLLSGLGYTAGIMDQLFNIFDSGNGRLTVGSLIWSYKASGFSTSGRAVGDTWQVGSGYDIWLSGANDATAVGLTAVPRPVMVYYFPFESGGSPSLANAGSIGGNATAVTVNSSTPAFSTDVPTSIGGSHSQIILMSPPGNQTGGRLDLPSGNSTFRLSTSGEQIAFSAWLKWSGVDGSADIRQGIVSNMNGALNQGWAFSVNSDGKLSLSLGGAPGRRDSASATVVTSGVWTNVAMTYTVGGNPKLFIDGTNVGISSSFGGGIATASTQTLRLGNVDGSFLPVNGILDDVAVWDLMLSDGKMRAIYTTPTLLSGLGYTAGIMDQLFNIFDSGNGRLTVGSLIWSYKASGFSTSGRAVGDTWQVGSGYDIWLSGANDATAVGLTAVSE